MIYLLRPNRAMESPLSRQRRPRSLHSSVTSQEAARTRISCIACRERNIKCSGPGATVPALYEMGFGMCYFGK
ncbi:hypothetical protein BJY00DRAFT_18346 [Aspergillus carlsbadensis]|nr:hypothetical protein BJY00DRAFT_18346 [Aspergillus carlsbadensis]